MAYEDFASVYDQLIEEDFDYGAWFEYIEEIYKREEVEVKTVLEIGCGTGTMATYIVKKYDYTGLDLSSEMLSIAYNKLEGEKARFLQQDMVDFQLNRKYNSVLSLCDSINYVLEYEDLVASFKNVYDHLEEGGIFIFDLNSQYKIKEVLGNNTFIDEKEKVFYSWENFLEGDIVEFYLNFFIEKDGLYERFEESHFERGYSVEEVTKALEEAGFRDYKYYKAFSFEDIDRTTERINYIVKK